MRQLYNKVNRNDTLHKQEIQIIKYDVYNMVNSNSTKKGKYINRSIKMTVMTPYQPEHF